MSRAISLCLTLMLTVPGLGDSPAPPNGPSAPELAGALRGLLISNLPEPLVHQKENWGKQVQAVSGNKKKNHGVWRKVGVTALNPANTLKLDVTNLQRPDANRTVFDLNIAFDAQIDFEQQIWERGLRLYSGSSRARAKVHVALQCEVTTRTETSKWLLPDLVFRFKVTKAKLGYSGLDFVHVAGVGGDGADLIGHSLHTFLKVVRPTLEAELLSRANAAIVKAGDTKEVRVSLSKLLSKK